MAFSPVNSSERPMPGSASRNFARMRIAERALAHVIENPIDKVGTAVQPVPTPVDRFLHGWHTVPGQSVPIFRADATWNVRNLEQPRGQAYFEPPDRARTARGLQTTRDYDEPPMDLEKEIRPPVAFSAPMSQAAARGAVFGQVERQASPGMSLDLPSGVGSGRRARRM
jgi:hypothetical protein